MSRDVWCQAASLVKSERRVLEARDVIFETSSNAVSSGNVLPPLCQCHSNKYMSNSNLDNDEPRQRRLEVLHTCNIPFGFHLVVLGRVALWVPRR